MRKNPCLEAALKELEAVGIRQIEQAVGGKHLQVRWLVNGHGLRVYNMPQTASDWRAVHNTRAGIRKMLREDGMLTRPERAELELTTPSATPKPDRLTKLEQRVETLENLVRTIQQTGEHRA